MGAGEPSTRKSRNASYTVLRMDAKDFAGA
jgi:hypothetical protein